MARRSRPRAALLLAVGVPAAGLLAACGGSTPPPRPPTAATVGWTQSGVASWYGPGFHGRPTASGERYDMQALTAAHPWLPFGTIVRVDNRDNGRAVDLRVNDRGPFSGGRILDVSRAAARRLGMIGPGTARVRVTVLEMGTGGVPATYPCRVLQVGAFRDPGGARSLRERVREAGHAARTLVDEDGLVRVLAGPFRTPAEAESAARRFGGFYRACDAAG